VGDKQQPPPRHVPLMELATRQHGVVSTRQLAEIGYTRSSASKANKVGRLHRVHRGVYAVGHRQLTWEGRCMAAVLARREAVASHLSAAWLWGLLRTRPTTIHITVPVKGSRSGLFVVHHTLLTDDDVRRRDRIPVTSLARTLLDFAAEAGRARLENAFGRAENSGRFDLPEVEGVLRRAGGHPGRGPLAAVVETYSSDPELTRSGVERRFRHLVIQAVSPGRR
jgi:predicted transcriptional regulator of viral defense system